MGQSIQSASMPLNCGLKKNKQMIPFSITPQKALFNYIDPLDINQQNEIHLNFIQHDIKREENEQNQNNIQQQNSIISTLQSIKQIKVKWNQFIKMKEQDYLICYDIIKKVIGKGGFGIVRKVKSKYTNSIRVAKCIKKKLLNKDDATKLFAELSIMKMLDHPNIIKLYEVYDYNDEFVLILQNCSGGEVITTGKSRRLTENKAAIIIKQLLRSLIYLHSQLIVHRDIKPQNMLFENQDKKFIKLIDFGIAIKMKQKQILQDRIGTPSYVAPEVIYKKYNQKCDVWATGITMFQLICGRTPFESTNEAETMREILRAQLQFNQPIWQHISQQYKDVIKLMLNKKAENRPSAKQVFENCYFNSIIENTENSPAQDEDKSLALYKMQTFKFKNKLQAVVRTYMASQLLTKQQKDVLVQVFKQFDTNTDGVISSEELRQALADRNNISVEKIDSIMRVVDINGSGQIDYTEFLVANCQSSLDFTRQRLKQVFKYFDSDHNGTISPGEVSEFLVDYESNDDEIKKVFQMVDLNGDGHISEAEFIDLLVDKMNEFSRSFCKSIEEGNDENKQNKIAAKREQMLKIDLKKNKKNNQAKRLSQINVNSVLDQLARPGAMIRSKNIKMN